MANFGTPYGPGGSTFNGASDFQPVPQEYALATQGAGTAAGVATAAADASHDAQVGGLVNIGEGAGQVGAAAAEIVASDGLLTPIALLQGANGLLQLYNGFQQMFQPGSPPGTVVSGLTPAQDAALTQAATDSAIAASNVPPDVSSIAAAVWQYQLHPPEPNMAGDDLRSLMEAMRGAVYLGYIFIGLPQVFQVVAPNDLENLQGSDTPVLRQSAYVAGMAWDTYLDTVNPSYAPWTAFGVGAWQGTGGTSDPPITIVVSEVDLVSYLAPVCEPPGWLDLVYPYLTYTPSSGPPSRSLFADMQLLFSLLPVRY